jgi:hypothetical protein
LGAVCSLASRLGSIQYLARLEAVSPDVRECCLFPSQTAPQRLDRFLKTLSSDTNHPHRVFYCMNVEVGSPYARHYSRSISMCHYSRNLPATENYGDPLPPTTVACRKGRLHVKTTGLSDMAHRVICFVGLGYGHGNCSVNDSSAITGLCTKLLSGCIAGRDNHMDICSYLGNTPSWFE